MLKIPNLHTTPPGKFLYTQPETGVVFHFGTWAEIVNNVALHRRAMSLDLADGFLDRLQHDACEQNKHWGCTDDSIPPSFETPLALAGRQCWRELHAFTESYPETPTEDDRSKAKYWLAGWRERIPRFGGCACREDWARLEANYPADYSSRASFVKWAVVSHDAINRKIGHPIWNQEWWDEAVRNGLNVFP